MARTVVALESRLRGRQGAAGHRRWGRSRTCRRSSAWITQSITHCSNPHSKDSRHDDDDGEGMANATADDMAFFTKGIAVKVRDGAMKDEFKET